MAIPKFPLKRNAYWMTILLETPCFPTHKHSFRTTTCLDQAIWAIYHHKQSNWMGRAIAYSFYIYIWLVVSTPLKNISQLGWWQEKTCSKSPTSIYIYYTMMAILLNQRVIARILYIQTIHGIWHHPYSKTHILYDITWDDKSSIILSYITTG